MEHLARHAAQDRARHTRAAVRGHDHCRRVVLAGGERDLGGRFSRAHRRFDRQPSRCQTADDCVEVVVRVGFESRVVVANVCTDTGRASDQLPRLMDNTQQDDLPAQCVRQVGGDGQRRLRELGSIERDHQCGLTPVKVLDRTHAVRGAH